MTKEEKFQIQKRLGLDPEIHKAAWYAVIKDVRVSIIEWADSMRKRLPRYDRYEIYSNDTLFYDVEQYDTWEEIMDRLEELNNE